MKIQVTEFLTREPQRKRSDVAKFDTLSPHSRQVIG
jgi:hypothetical protein